MVEKTLKIPLPLDLPKPEERKFENQITEKPAHPKVEIKFGDVT